MYVYILLEMCSVSTNGERASPANLVWRRRPFTKGSGVDPMRYLCQRNLVPPHFSVTFSRECVLYFGANDFLIPGE